MNIPEKLIQDSIGHLNENKITSPEHFKAILNTATLMKENKESEKVPNEHKKCDIFLINNYSQLSPYNMVSISSSSKSSTKSLNKSM
jgi:hypothetical protein